MDLIAIRESRILLVECKTGHSPYLPSKQLNYIMEISRKVNADVILAVRKKHQRVRWFKATEHGIEEIELKAIIRAGKPIRL